MMTSLGSDRNVWGDTGFWTKFYTKFDFKP